MKIKISYTDNELKQADDIELILRRFFNKKNNLKIRKPKNSDNFNHTYISVGKVPL